MNMASGRLERVAIFCYIQSDQAVSYLFTFSPPGGAGVSVCFLLLLTIILLWFSAGEDGQVKIWSRSGMLRSTLSQNSK